MKDQNIKQAFIEYLKESNHERFFQALANFTQLPYIGVASDPAGRDFKELWHIEGDKEINWEGKKA